MDTSKSSQDSLASLSLTLKDVIQSVNLVRLRLHFVVQLVDLLHDPATLSSSLGRVMSEVELI